MGYATFAKKHIPLKHSKDSPDQIKVGSIVYYFLKNKPRYGRVTNVLTSTSPHEVWANWDYGTHAQLGWMPLKDVQLHKGLLPSYITTL